MGFIMGLNNYTVNLWGTEVKVCSEDSRNAVYCALIRNKIPLNTVKVTKEVKRKNDNAAKVDTRLKIAVKDVETGVIDNYRAVIKG